MEVEEVPVTVQPTGNPAFSTQFARTRRIILYLTIGLVLSYMAVIWMDVVSWAILVFSIPMLAFYNIAECICFFGCKQLDYCTILIFRIIFLLHDVAYFITCCIFAGRYGGLYFGLAIFLAIAIGLNIAIMIFLGKLPRYASCCFCAQQTLQYTNGPTSQPRVQPYVQTGQYNQYGHY